MRVWIARGEIDSMISDRGSMANNFPSNYSSSTPLAQDGERERGREGEQESRVKNDPRWAFSLK